MKLDKFKLIGGTVLLAATLHANATPLVIPSVSPSHENSVLTVNNQKQNAMDVTVLHFDVKNNGTMTLKDNVSVMSNNVPKSLKMDIAYGDMHHQTTTVTINKDGTVSQSGKPVSMVAQGSYNVVIANDWQHSYNASTQTYETQNNLLTNAQVSSYQQKHDNDMKHSLELVGLIGLFGVSLMGYALSHAMKDNKEEKQKKATLATV